MCKRASGKFTKHQALNDVIDRAFVAADMSFTKELNGLSISDNKRPDGLTLSPWQEGKPLAWDVTAHLSFGCMSYVSGYLLVHLLVHLPNWPPPESARSMPIYPINSYIFQPIAFENLGTLNVISHHSYLCVLGHKISIKSNDIRESTFLFQRLAITLQRFNSILLRESFVCDTDK